MDNNQQPTTPNQGDTTKKIATTVKCPQCGHEYQVEVEIPEKTETPKMTWET